MFCFNGYEDGNKFYCVSDVDCVLSRTDKEFPLVCVNDEWFEVNKRDVGVQCDSRKELYCLCQNNVCIRNDYRIGCD